MNIPIGEYLLPQKPLVPARPYFACVGSDPLWFRYGDGGCDKELLARSFVAVVIINRILMFAWGNESKQDLNPIDVSRFTFIDNNKVIFSNPLHQQVS